MFHGKLQIQGIALAVGQPGLHAPTSPPSWVPASHPYASHCIFGAALGSIIPVDSLAFAHRHGEPGAGEEAGKQVFVSCLPAGARSGKAQPFLHGISVPGIWYPEKLLLVLVYYEHFGSLPHLPMP